VVNNLLITPLIGRELAVASTMEIDADSAFVTIAIYSLPFSPHTARVALAAFSRFGWFRPATGCQLDGEPKWSYRKAGVVDFEIREPVVSEN
jgi:hypothetical protein